MFFSLLTFYLAIKDEPSTKNGRMKIILSLAVAGGIKLSGLLIAPIIFAIVFKNFRFLSLTDTAKVLFKSILFFLFFLIIFTNPLLLDAPFHLNRLTDYWAILSHFIGVTKQSADSLTPLERFYSGVFGNDMNLLASVILYLGIFIYSANNKITGRGLLPMLNHNVNKLK